MQMSKPNESKSGPAPRSPPSGTARVRTQLSSLSLKSAAMNTSGPGGLHKKNKSSTASAVSAYMPPTGLVAAGSSKGRAESPIKQSQHRKHGSSTSMSKSAKSSPVRPVKSGTTKTPNKGNANLSKSLGPVGGIKDSSVVAAGGLGRMDIIAKDWDGLLIRSTSNSPQKRRSNCTKVRLIRSSTVLPTEKRNLWWIRDLIVSFPLVKTTSVLVERLRIRIPTRRMSQ